MRSLRGSRGPGGPLGGVRGAAPAANYPGHWSGVRGAAPAANYPGRLGEVRGAAPANESDDEHRAIDRKADPARHAARAAPPGRGGDRAGAGAAARRARRAAGPGRTRRVDPDRRGQGGNQRRAAARGDRRPGGRVDLRQPGRRTAAGAAIYKETGMKKRTRIPAPGKRSTAPVASEQAQPTPAVRAPEEPQPGIAAQLDTGARLG